MYSYMHIRSYVLKFNCTAERQINQVGIQRSTEVATSRFILYSAMECIPQL